MQLHLLEVLEEHDEHEHHDEQQVQQEILVQFDNLLLSTSKLIQLLNIYWEVELNLIMQTQQTYISEKVRNSSNVVINPATEEKQDAIVSAIEANTPIT